MPSSRQQLDKYNTIILILMHYKGKFYYEWWELFQNPVVCTKFDIYVFIPIDLWKGFKNSIKWNTGKYWQLIWHNNVIENNDVIWKFSVSNGNIRLYLIRNIYASIYNKIWQDIIFKVGHVFI